MAEYNILALLILPILFQGEPVGALTVYYSQPHEFAKSQLQLGLTLAQTLAIIIRNAYLYQAKQEQRQLAEALAQAAASVSSSLELADVLDHILQQIMRVVPCQAANIMLIEGEKVILARHRGYEDYISDTSIIDLIEVPMTWPGLQEMYSEGKPVFMVDTHADDRWQRTADTDWVRSFIGMPLKIDQQVVGFLNLDGNEPGQINKDFLVPLRTFADYASTAIKNARLYESSHQRAEEMSALVRAASAVASSFDYLQILQVVAEQMTKRRPSEFNPVRSHLMILIWMRLPMWLGMVENWDIKSKWEKLSPMEDYPVTRTVLEKNIPFQLQIENPDLNPIQQQFMDDANTNTLLLLPLITQDQILGLVVLMDDAKDRIFSDCTRNRFGPFDSSSCCHSSRKCSTLSEAARTCFKPRRTRSITHK